MKGGGLGDEWKVDFPVPGSVRVIWFVGAGYRFAIFYGLAWMKDGRI